MNAPDRSIFDSAEKLMQNFGQQAFDNLADKLRDGKTVGRCHMGDLIDLETNSDRYRIFREEVESLLLSDSDVRNSLADKLRDGLIERFLLAHPELIEEEAAEIEAAEEA